MKPTLTKFPKTDCHYHAIAVEPLNGVKTEKTYWRFSREYFNSEAENAGDAAVFVTMMLTAVVPLVTGVLAVMHGF